MILIGQFDSPFTRRVGITMELYNLPFEHRPWSVFGDADKLSEVNPLIRVPTLVLDTSEALLETSSIIDYLDGLVAPEQRLLPQAQPTRYQAMKVISVAAGISDKAVNLFYEMRLHDTPSEAYVARLTMQITGALEWLENDRLKRSGATWFGGKTTQADIAVTCMFRHLDEAFPQFSAQLNYPHLAKHAAQFEEQLVFQKISQAFIAPA